jgi:adenine deaminase
MEISSLIKVARGEEPTELLLKNCKVVNVFSVEIEETVNHMEDTWSPASTSPLRP